MPCVPLRRPMPSLLFPTDTRAPMLAVERDDKWVRTWEWTPRGILVNIGMISDWEAYAWKVGMMAVTGKESDG